MLRHSLGGEVIFLLMTKYFFLLFIALFGEDDSACPGVHFINTKPRHFKCQKKVFKRQQWRFTFSKFHKTILVFKMPKCDMVISNIGVFNAKNKAFKTPKKEAFKMPKLAFKFYEMDLWTE